MYTLDCKCDFWLEDGAYIPTRSHANDGGLDLRAMSVTVKDNEGYAIVDTGVHIVIEDGFVGLLFGRSGNHLEKGWHTQGVIDSGYTGSIKMRLHRDYESIGSFSDIRSGDRVGQLVIVPIPSVQLTLRQCDVTEQRGEAGFGSTGR